VTNPVSNPNVPSSTIVTIGTFDGVHRGHEWLLRQVRTRAEELGGRSLAVTFEPIPISVLRPELYRGRICTASRKIELISEAGIDHVSVIQFNRDLASRSPEEFLKWLLDESGMTELWVGNDFALGKNRIGTVNRIAEIGEELGFTTHPLERMPDDGQPISSSRIRAAVEAGEMLTARAMLGRPFRVSGTVIHGAHLGRQIGFPTANFVPPEGIVPLPDGIFASVSYLEGEETAYPSMTYVGSRPTVDGTDQQVETNLFDFTGDLYGQVLNVDVIEKIRDDVNFDGLDPLIAQLKQDESDSRLILEGLEDSGSLQIESLLPS
jgi:riboflavin kinase / FMN adenylyltransferase